MRLTITARPCLQILRMTWFENTIHFIRQVPILGEADLKKKIFRVQLSKKVADVVASSFRLLGINVRNECN